MIRVAAIVGPTAAGKSAISIEVAERLGAEIVSVDSMQIYRGMDIGTDKADAAMRARIPHHLLDLKDPSEELTVAEYQGLGRGAIEEIAARWRLPLLVGGSGLYFRAIVDDLRFPPRDASVRAELEDEGERLGAAALHERLAAADPAAAEKIEPGNTRRTVRALEVIALTGQPFSATDGWSSYEALYDLTVAGVTRARSELYERIAGRVDRMLRSGLVEEVERLRSAGLSRSASQALGYRQVLDAAGAPAPEIRDGIVAATKRFARRQEAWFKADPRITWFDASEPGLAGVLAQRFSSRPPGPPPTP